MSPKLAKILIAVATLAALALLFWGDVGADLRGVGVRSVLLPFLSSMVLFALGMRTVLWWVYRPMAPAADELAGLPSLTVVVPAYNEGPGVRKTIESILASAYPPELLTVIAVNDGSKDDTGVHIDAAAAACPERVTALHMPKNGGKRRAVHAGWSRARSEIVATVDSDSVVPPDSLANLVTPMVRDPRIGGVAGQVLVANREQNLLTRMLGVRYILGFDYIRAYQSMLRTVWCCPGALQAYRRAVIAPHLDGWRDQRFLGAQCTNGDDHAMTNLVLSLGYHTVYQANAPVFTLVPSHYVRLTKMFLRWGRSATREGLRAMRFAPRRTLLLGPVRGPLMLFDAVLQPLTIFAKLVGFGFAFYVLFAHPIWFARAALATTLIAVLYGLVFLRSERSTEVLFGILYAWFAMFGLIWVQPLATLTVRKNGWMTRG
ncbi:MAG: glycosyltransferase [Deltaproteobacteria bacterium]|nr:MAG: glycosyltransferase [Deltaproteobacteria bacterium]